MALSDACDEFLVVVETLRREPTQYACGAVAVDDLRREAAIKFAEAIAHYSQAPFAYGDEIEMLALACGGYLGKRQVGNDDPLERLMFLAEAIRDGLDTPPPPPISG